MLELAFMPVVDATGGALCWFVARRIGGAFGTYLASFVYAIFTAAGVGVVLLLAGNALLVRRI